MKWPTVCAAATVDLVKRRVGQRRGDLTHPVRPEVQPQHRVAGADPRLVADGRRLDELVGLAALIGRLHGLWRGLGVMVGAAVDEQVVGSLEAVPALVAVHREVPADDRADTAGAGPGHPLLHTRQEAGARVGRRVAPVGEGVHDQVGHLQLRGEVDQRLEVLEARVHAPV